jgi:hypothetical protein
MEITTSQELLDVLVAHLNAGKRLMIKSYTRPTVYDKRHITMFRASTREGDTGVYVGWPGKRSVYVAPQMWAFEK